MNLSMTCFSDAQAAWSTWNLTEFEFKCECLLSITRSLQETNPQLASVMAFQLKHAEPHLAQPQLMPGPTGEVNELYTAGRGVCVLLLQAGQECDQDQQALMAQLTVALLAGNSVLVCSDNLEFNQQISQAMAASLPAHVLQFVAFDAYKDLLQQDIRVAGLVGDGQFAQKINRILAATEGALVPLLVETDLVALPNALDPNLVLRFITERTRTINITAVGGNATLLELGSEH